MELQTPPCYAPNYDWIIRREGGVLTTGYVLYKKIYIGQGYTKIAHPKSGITIGGGIDLGWTDYSLLDDASKHGDIKQICEKYIGIRGEAAHRFLEKNPLRITEEQANRLTTAKYSQIENKVVSAYELATGGVFSQLSVAKQTIIMSLAIQYGANLKRSTPKSWIAITTGTWQELLAELRNFGDDHDHRRNAEADLLECDIIGANTKLAKLLSK